MQKSEYLTCFDHSVLFFCSKRCEIKFDTLFDYENQQQKRITKYCNKSFCRYCLQRFSEDLQRMHKKKHSFLTIVTTLPKSDPIRFRKNVLQSYKIDSNG